MAETNGLEPVAWRGKPDWANGAWQYYNAPVQGYEPLYSADAIERLTQEQIVAPAECNCDDPDCHYSHIPLTLQQAHQNAVDRLRTAEVSLSAAQAEIAELKEALKPFAEAGRAIMLTGGTNPKLSGERLAEHLDRARSLIGGNPDAG